MPNWTRNIVFIFTILASSCTVSSPTSTQLDKESGFSSGPTHIVDSALETMEVSNLTLAEKKSRSSAVRVVRPFSEGHGSGTYMKMHGRLVVVTAAHVVEGYTVMFLREADGTQSAARVIYKDDEADIAVLQAPELKSRVAIPYRPKKNDKNLLGAYVSYTGFPGRHELITIRGHVASLERNMIVINMFGWFGASGSGVFDREGRFLGVVSAIDVGNIGVPIPLDSIVWVAPAWDIDEETLKIRVVTAPPLTAFNSFPGAPAPRRGGPRD